MDKKLGRPKTDNPKNEQYRLRMNADEVKMLEWCCEQTGKNKAEILRLGLITVYESLQTKK